jgi:lactoylglutathione lyase
MRTLHPAYRVTDLGASVVFYAALGYGQVGRVDLGEGASLTMLKFPSDEFVALELVHRPGDAPVDIGTGFSHLAVQIDNLKATVEALTQAGLRPGPIELPGGDARRGGSALRLTSQRAISEFRWSSKRDSNAGELWRTSTNHGELLTPAVDFKSTLANRAERWRTMRPPTSKPLVSIPGDVDGRIVPVAPPPMLNSKAPIPAITDSA